MRLYATNRKGFSLIEVLVSAGILMIFFIVLTQSLNLSGNIWTGGRSRSETRRVLRTVQDMIRSELRAIALPISNEVVSGRADLQFVINPDSLSADFQNADTFFWQAPIATDLSEGKFAEVGYFVRWQNNRASLCRLFLNPHESRALLGSTGAKQRVYQHPGNWVNDDVLNAAAPADETSGYLGLFTENVIAFWVRPFNRNGTVEYNAGSAGFDSNLPYDGYPGPVVPSAIEVSFVIIDSASASNLANRSDAATLITQIQTLAANARTASGRSPAAEFVANLASNTSLQFLYKGAHSYQMLVDLPTTP